MQKRILLALAFTVAAFPAVAEVWNDPGGVSVTATSQVVQFPRPMSSVLVLNDDATNEVYLRLFWCGATTPYAAATTSSLEIKATKSRSFTNEPRTEPNFYCAVTIVCDTAETATVRVEAK